MIKLPLLYHDYDAKESSWDIVEALLTLESTSREVFDGIKAKIERHKHQLNALDQRVANTKHKVAQIAQRSGKATTVIASSKFPVEDKGIRQNEINGEALNQAIQNRVSGARVSSLKADEFEPPDPAGWNVEDEYHILPLDSMFKMYDSVVDGWDRSDGYLRTGFGPLPHQIETLGEALFYDSGETPYVQYFDGKSGRDRMHSMDHDLQSIDSMEDKGNRLADAPVSMIDGDILPEIGEYDVSFKPKMRDMAQFNLPSNLNLPDIADNISFLGGQQQVVEASIAPSVHIAGIPELPTILDFVPPDDINRQTKQDHQQQEQVQNRVSEQAITAQVNEKSTPPPPPPPKSEPPAESIAAAAARRASENVAQTPTQSKETTQPKQEPAVEEASSSSRADSGRVVQETPAPPKPMPLPSGGGGKMDLLAAIRNKDSLVRLKTTAEAKRREEAQKQKQQQQQETEDTSSNGDPVSSSSKPLSLAEEMRLKLARRQKILSGQQDEEEQRAEQVRKKALGGALRATEAAGKLMSKLNQQKKNSGLLTLDGMAGLDDLLKAREQASEHDSNEVGDNEDDSGHESDWLD